MTTLIAFGQDQIKVLGRAQSGLYLARCFKLWEKTYGESVARKVRVQLEKDWKASK